MKIWIMHVGNTAKTSSPWMKALVTFLCSSFKKYPNFLATSSTTCSTIVFLTIFITISTSVWGHFLYCRTFAADMLPYRSWPSVSARVRPRLTRKTSSSRPKKSDKDAKYGRRRWLINTRLAGFLQLTKHVFGIKVFCMPKWVKSLGCLIKFRRYTD